MKNVSLDDDKLRAEAERIWPRHVATSEDLRERNIQHWMRSVSILGSRWILAGKVTRNPYGFYGRAA